MRNIASDKWFSNLKPVLYIEYMYISENICLYGPITKLMLLTLENLFTEKIHTDIHESGDKNMN